MNTLLIFFAIPIAVIILSTILETYMKSPLKVAGIFFSIFLVVAFYLGGSAEYIVAALVYTSISFITAYLTELILSRSYFCKGKNSNFYTDINRTNSSEFELPITNDNINYNNDFENINTCNNCYRRYR